MLITFLCFSAISPMMAQDIKGKIVDEKGQPLAFANVVLLNRQDSAFVKGVVSGEDGHFAIDSPCNNGIIKVTSVGYKTVWKDCAGENAGVIKMMADSKILGEVVVKSSLPKTILKHGGMTTTVAGSVLEKAGTMEHLLDRIPNVSAQNGSLLADMVHLIRMEKEIVFFFIHKLFWLFGCKSTFILFDFILPLPMFSKIITVLLSFLLCSTVYRIYDT